MGSAGGSRLGVIVRASLLIAAGLLVALVWLLGRDLLGVGLARLHLAWIGVPAWTRRRLALLYLDAMLIGYALAMAGGIAMIGVGLAVGRLSRADPARRRRRQVRLLVPGASLLLSLVALDVGASAWDAWRQRPPRPAERATRSQEGRPGGVGDRAWPSTGAPPGSPPGPLHLAVIGESSARGDPYDPWLSIGQIVGWKLESVLRGRPVAVEIAAGGGATIQGLGRQLADLKDRPDALIVCVGHNEFEARFPWSREPGNYYEDENPALYSPEVLTAMLRHSPTCRLVLETWDRQRVDVRPPRRITRELIDQPAYTPDEYREILDEFRRRLEDVVAYCENIRAVPILIIPASNDGGFDPSRSVLSPATPRAEREAFAHEVTRARALEADDPAEALRLDLALAARHPEFAETHYRLGRLRERRGEWEPARRQYVAARECDGFPLRCREDFRRAYRETAARHPSVLLVDSPKVLRALSAHGILDDRLFHDAQHPNLRGYTALARDLLRQLRDRGAFGWPAGIEPPAFEPRDCARHFALDPDRWAHICGREARFYEGAAFICHDPTFRLSRSEEYRRARAAIRSGRDPSEAGMPGWGPRSTIANLSRPQPSPSSHSGG